MEFIQESAHRPNFCLMIWETNPRNRNKNNEIQFNLLNGIEIKQGDILKIGGGNEEKGFNYSCYELTEVIEVKPSNMEGKNLVTAKTRWFPFVVEAKPKEEKKK